MNMKWLISLFLALSLQAGQSQPVPVPATLVRTNQNINLAWDVSPSIGVVSYLIRRGVRPGVYDQQIQVNGKFTTTVTWSNAPTSVTNYFMATSVMVSGLESDPSNELQVIMEVRPVPPVMRTAVPITVMIKSLDGRLRLSAGPYYVVTEGTNDSFRAELSTGSLVPVLLR